MLALCLLGTKPNFGGAERGYCHRQDPAVLRPGRIGLAMQNARPTSGGMQPSVPNCRQFGYEEGTRAMPDKAPTDAIRSAMQVEWGL